MQYAARITEATDALLSQAVGVYARNLRCYIRTYPHTATADLVMLDRTRGPILCGC